MYYDEKIINGVLMFRVNPRGKWQQCSIVHMGKRIVDQESRIAALEAELRREHRHKEVYRVFSHDHLVASIGGAGKIEDVIEAHADQLVLAPQRLLTNKDTQ